MSHLYVGTNGHVVAINVTSGKERWRTALGSGVFSATSYQDVNILDHDGKQTIEFCKIEYLRGIQVFVPQGQAALSYVYPGGEEIKGGRPFGPGFPIIQFIDKNSQVGIRPVLVSL